MVIHGLCCWLRSSDGSSVISEFLVIFLSCWSSSCCWYCLLGALYHERDPFYQMKRMLRCCESAQFQSLLHQCFLLTTWFASQSGVELQAGGRWAVCSFLLHKGPMTCWGCEYGRLCFCGNSFSFYVEEQSNGMWLWYNMWSCSVAPFDRGQLQLS